MKKGVSEDTVLAALEEFDKRPAKSVEVLEESLQQPPFEIVILVTGLFTKESDYRGLVKKEMEERYPLYRPICGGAYARKSGRCESYRLLPDGNGGWRRHCLNNVISFEVDYLFRVSYLD